MILGVDKIRQLIRQRGLLKNLSVRERLNPEGAGIDLRLGELYEISGEGFLGIDERKTPKAKRVACFDEQKRKKISLKPGAYYTMTTVEEINTPPNILVLFCARSTLYRSGVMLLSGNCSPGYRGKLTFGLINLGKKLFRVEMGARIAHAIFYEVKGSTRPYRGQWQGGRVDTGGRETQV